MTVREIDYCREDVRATMDALNKLKEEFDRHPIGLYLSHPEAKSLAPDGTPCGAETRGLLRRASITAGDHRPILKETDRMSEHGEALTVVDPKMAEITPTRVVADGALKAKIRAFGMRPLMRTTGLSQHTLEKLVAGQAVRRATLQRVTAVFRR